MRLEQENDDLAHELVTSKIALRNDLDQVMLREMGPAQAWQHQFWEPCFMLKWKHEHNIKNIIICAFIFLTTSLLVAIRRLDFHVHATVGIHSDVLPTLTVPSLLWIVLENVSHNL